jgi:hypothetical protein
MAFIKPGCQWKIVSDGMRTKVYDAEGNELRFVRAISWSHPDNGIPSAVVELMGVALEAEITASER